MKSNSGFAALKTRGFAAAERITESKIGIKKKIALAVLSAAVTALAGYLFFDFPYTAAASPVVYLIAISAYSRYSDEKRRKTIRFQFRDALYSFSSSLSGGRHISEAVREAIPYLSGIYGSDAYLVSELKNMSADMTAAGATETEAFAGLAQRTGIEDIYDFVSVLDGCRVSGGNTIEAVDRAASLITEKIDTENEIRVMSAQKKFEGRMIALMPPAVILMLRLISPGYLDPLYHTAEGRLIMIVSLAIMAAAGVASEKITDISV
ncbi:MAG: type II secretion system F family protein [Eubacterium sp.]|jgi:tight adherence protein B